MTDRPKDHEVWKQAVKVATKEPRDILVYHPESVRRELRHARGMRGRRVPKILQSIIP
jgi:hypothetical protein